MLWPIFRLLQSNNRRRVRWLFLVFLIHAASQTITFIFVLYYQKVDSQWLHCLLLPYCVGAISLCAGALVLLFTKDAQ